MQSNKDSQGGKTSSQKKSSSAKAGSTVQEKKSVPNSPTGAMKHGEKKTTPH